MMRRALVGIDEDAGAVVVVGVIALQHAVCAAAVEVEPVAVGRLGSVAERLAILDPLTPDWTTQPVWTDGRPSKDFIAEFIKPNDRMTALERIELYNKQYWYRLIDIMYEDYPGLALILGDRQFHQFCAAYLNAHPSRSGLLRNLG